MAIAPGMHVDDPSDDSLNLSMSEAARPLFDAVKKFITDEDREESDGHVNRVQLETKRIGNSLIDDINREFQSNGKFHSVYIQKGNEDVDLEKVIEGTVSAVYTMPKQNSEELFDKFSNLLISKKISGGGGFYDIANDMSNDETYGIPVSYTHLTLPTNREV